MQSVLSIQVHSTRNGWTNLNKVIKQILCFFIPGNLSFYSWFLKFLILDSYSFLVKIVELVGMTFFPLPNHFYLYTNTN